MSGPGLARCQIPSIYMPTVRLNGESPVEGTYNFTATVEGPGWSDGSRNYTVLISPLLTFAPQTLPYGTENSAYSQAITVSGGD